MIETLKKPFERVRILKDPFSRVALLGSFGTILAVLVLIIFTVGSLSVPVVLKFNDRQGILLFGEQSQIFGIWFSFLALWILNTLLAEFLYFRERILSHTLVVLNGFLSLFLLAAILTVIFVN